MAGIVTILGLGLKEYAGIEAPPEVLATVVGLVFTLIASQTARDHSEAKVRIAEAQEAAARVMAQARRESNDRIASAIRGQGPGARFQDPLG
jgi:hypothetical protein